MHFPIKFGASKIEEPLKVPYTDDQSKERIIQRLLDYYADAVPGQEIVIVCIGTDRSTGDSLGPLVGSKLLQMGFRDQHLFGTLYQPVHAMNLKENLQQIQQRFQTVHRRRRCLSWSVIERRSYSGRQRPGEARCRREQRPAPRRRYSSDRHRQCRRIHGIFRLTEYPSQHRVPYGGCDRRVLVPITARTCARPIPVTAARLDG